MDEWLSDTSPAWEFAETVVWVRLSARVEPKVRTWVLEAESKRWTLELTVDDRDVAKPDGYG